MGGRVTYDPLTANHQEPLAKVGERYSDKDGKVYVYTQFLDAVTYANGQVVTWANATATAVTNDRTGGSAVFPTLAVGVAMNAVNQNYYGYIQVWGYHATVQSDGGVAAGEALVAHTVDGQADTMAAGEEHLVFGHSLAADSGSDTPTFLTCL